MYIFYSCVTQLFRGWAREHGRYIPSPATRPAIHRGGRGGDGDSARQVIARRGEAQRWVGVRGRGRRRSLGAHRSGRRPSRRMSGKIDRRRENRAVHAIKSTALPRPSSSPSSAIDDRRAHRFPFLGVAPQRPSSARVSYRVA